MSAATMPETDIHPAWCDWEDGPDDVCHWHWIRGEGWEIYVSQTKDDATPAIHVDNTRDGEPLTPGEARDLADGVLAAVAMLRA